jgi:hypothetical protein
MEQQTETTVNNDNPLLQLHFDILLYIASFLKDTTSVNLRSSSDTPLPNPYVSLLALGLVAKRLRSIMFTILWNELVRTGSRTRIFQFLEKRFFTPPSLTLAIWPYFYGELDSKTGGRQGVDRLIALRYGSSGRLAEHHYLSKIPDAQQQRVTYGTATRLDFKTTAAYHAYLLAHPLDEYLDSDDRWLQTDEKGQTLGRVFTRDMTVFHALTLTFSQIYSSLDRIVLGKTQLPPPFRVKEDFETTAAYFEYLINHVHDLYITLRTNPNIINIQDEYGKTLLFYVVHAAKYLEKDRIQWIVLILLGTPNINLNLIDIAGNTFLHEATKHCADTSRNEFGLKENESVFFDYVFVPFVDYAQKNNFNFELLNKAGLAALHLAAQIPGTEHPWVDKISAVIEAPREVDPIATLNACKNIDFNQLSEENCTALYYAIACSHLPHIYTLLSHSNFETASQRKVISLLRDKINRLSRAMIAKLQEPASIATNNYFESSKLASDRTKIATYFMILTEILTKMTGKSYEQDRYNVWPTRAFITRVVERFQSLSLISHFGSDVDAKETTNRLITNFKLVITGDSIAEYYDTRIWNFLTVRNISSPLFKIFTQTIQEEIEQLIVDVNCMTETYKDEPKKEGRLEDLISLLTDKLLSAKTIRNDSITEILSKYFNELTEKINIKQCDALFTFLISHREANKTTPMWQQTVGNRINWQKLITQIRDQAVKNVEETISLLSNERACSYLDECCALKLFNLPNGILEQFGNTKAVNYLLELKAKFTVQLTIKGRSA